eukprot:1153682-Pelagomonas_calceolata.AAC.2
MLFNRGQRCLTQCLWLLRKDNTLAQGAPCPFLKEMERGCKFIPLKPRMASSCFQAFILYIKSRSNDACALKHSQKPQTLQF